MRGAPWKFVLQTKLGCDVTLQRTSDGVSMIAVPGSCSGLAGLRVYRELLLVFILPTSFYALRAGHWYSGAPFIPYQVMDFPLPFVYSCSR